MWVLWNIHNALCACGEIIKKGAYRAIRHGTKHDMKQFKRILSLVMALVMVLSLVYLAPAQEAEAANAYVSTTYAANLSVKTTKATALRDNPTTSAAAKYTLPTDTMLTVKALHKSTAGSYWYEVLFYDMTMYVDATATTLVAHLTGDVTIEDEISPASLTYGSSFGIEGVITSTLNSLGKIEVSMRPSVDITNIPVMSASANANGKSYDLDGSAIDSALAFGDMDPGVYTYVVTAEAVSYYIDNNGTLATSTQTVVVETQECVVTDWKNPNDDLAFGIDVSVWQGAITWSKVKNDVDFAILRIGFAETLDNRFLEYAKGCVDNGIPFGVYLYSYTLTAAGAIKEAEFVIKTLQQYGYYPQMGVWYDMEDSTQAALSTSLLETICTNFCETIADAGYQPGFYGFTRWFSSSYQKGYLSSIPVWIAQIDGFSSNGTATHNGGTWLWQYSWEGSISGISGDVDCNLCYADFGLFGSDASYLSKCTKYPTHAIGKTTSSVTMRQYPSNSHTSLGTITSGTQLEVTGLFKNASGEYWYQVKNGSNEGYVNASYMGITKLLYNDLSAIDPTMADNLNTGSGYNLDGYVASQYNNIYTTYAKVYSGEDTQKSPVLSSSYNNNSQRYWLKDSKVCDNLIFSNLSAGYYTYEISVDVKHYYLSNGSLTSKTQNVVLWTAPFTVGNAAITPPTQLVCSHNIVTDPAVAATCTAAGKTAGTHCSKCGVVLTAQTTIPATGHNYTATSEPANCQNYQLFHYTCTRCGDKYDISADKLGNWSETKPLNVPANQIQTKTQYRYADCTSKSWQQSGTNTLLYVNSWPSGFNTSNSLYSQYNKKSSKVTAGETSTTKTVINSDKVVGYLYYHWCYTDSYTSTASKSGSYTTFHAYYSTDNPDSYTCDTSDMSYKTSHSTCSNSPWYFVAEVYGQNYTTYKAAADGQSWGPWSAWSDTVYTAIANSRKVETRTLYRYNGATLGSHVWNDGSCSVCGIECDHIFSGGVCTKCGFEEASKEYYLFGWINGQDYACEGDFENLGIYHFVDGKLTVTFEQTSYVGVKTGDNANWYMTNGWQGEVSSATLYSTTITGTSSDKLYVPGNVQVTFTLVENPDGSLTLSYSSAKCTHPKHSTSGLCSSCGEAVAHTYVNNVCNVCGKTKAVPTLTPNYPTVSFEGAIQLNIYFTATNLDGVNLNNVGLLVFNTAQSNGTIDTASSVVPGAVSDGSKYMVHTEGIAAKNLGNTMYFKIYARLEDGSYVYSTMFSTSPKAYALSIIKNTSNSEQIRSLCVAMLNYGAAAQTYFSYKSYDLMNKTLTADQKALVQSYNESMMDDLVPATGVKGAAFVRNTTAFTSMYPTVSFEGAFAINYYFVNGLKVDNTMTMYYWTADTYNKVSQLTRTNANGSITMVKDGDRYWAEISNIAAKDMDSTIYVAGVYTSGGTSYTTGVIAYSLGRYCEGIASNTSSDAQALAAQTAVYGYYAERYFDYLYG